jgi:hypothetical protein
MDKIKFDGSNWKIKTVDRSRGRMKINIKLSKDEAEGFKNWATLVRPDTISDEDFFKQIFFNGIEFLNQKLQQISQQIMNDPEMRKNLEASGISVSALENSLPKP